MSKMTATTFLFDGSFDGLLSAVFTYYEQKAAVIKLVPAALHQPELLEDAYEIFSDLEKAKRVWTGLGKKLSKDWLKIIYTCYLSEEPDAYQHIFNFILHVFNNSVDISSDYGHPDVIALTKIDRSVNREQHRMKAFIRFQQTTDGVYYATIEPDFNVLPLIADFFQKRFADQKWIIYDRKRGYGLYYDLYNVEEISFETIPDTNDVLHDGELLYTNLWNDYFRSTNIPARKNMKLHIRHVPRRYWKLLTEKMESKVLFFVAILFPDDISAQITEIKNEFADRFESSRALKVMPHITLKIPFTVAESEKDAVINWFNSLPLSCSQNEITLNGFGSFVSKTNHVIYVKPEVSEDIRELQQEMVASFYSRFGGKPHVYDEKFAPHVTVAYRDLTAENYEKAWEEFETREFHASYKLESLTLLRHDGTKWQVASSISINGRSTTTGGAPPKNPNTSADRDTSRPLA